MSSKRKRNSGGMNLNDDVHFLIFAKLSFKDQISCALAYPRFRIVVHSIWRRIYTDVDISRKYDRFRYDFQSLNIILEGIHDIIKTMQIELRNTRQWNIVRQYSYPNVTHLKWHSGDFTPDRHQLKITQIFKNVRTLFIFGSLPTGNYFENFEHLEELYIHRCTVNCFHSFEKILEKTHLKRLRMRHLSEDIPRWTSELAFKKFCALEEMTLQGISLTLLTNLPHCPNLKLVQLIQTACTTLLVDSLKSLARHNNSIEVRATHCTFQSPLKLRIWTFMGLQDLNLNCEDIKDFMAKNDHLIVEDIYAVLPLRDDKCDCVRKPFLDFNYDSKHLSNLKRLEHNEVYQECGCQSNKQTNFVLNSVAR